MTNRPYRVCIVQDNDDEGKRSDFFDIGKLWKSKNGKSLVGYGILGKIVVLPPDESAPASRQKDEGSDDMPF